MYNNTCAFSPPWTVRVSVNIHAQTPVHSDSLWVITALDTTCMEVLLSEWLQSSERLLAEVLMEACPLGPSKSQTGYKLGLDVMVMLSHQYSSILVQQLISDRGRLRSICSLESGGKCIPYIKVHLSWKKYGVFNFQHDRVVVCLEGKVNRGSLHVSLIMVFLNDLCTMRQEIIWLLFRKICYL